MSNKPNVVNYGQDPEAIKLAIRSGAARANNPEMADRLLVEARAALSSEFEPREGDPPMTEFKLAPGSLGAKYPRYINNLYVVTLSPPMDAPGFPCKIIHISISRVDRSNRICWRHKQIIKNKLIGPKHEAVELYPSRDRVVDGANQFHLWVLADSKLSFPFGFTSDREVMTQEEARSDVPGVHQAPFVDDPEEL